MMDKNKGFWLSRILVLSVCLCFLMTGCAMRQDPTRSETAMPEIKEDTKILIAYFTRMNSTDATLDEIIQGGGPYGSLGNSFADADVDDITSASITIVDGEVKGNVEVFAETIQSLTKGDLFSIETVENYPTNYDSLIDQGGQEKEQNMRPELRSHVENMEDYDIIFLGFPNWWYDMPMPMYTFLEENDFSRKTVIPFISSAGSGFSQTVSTIQDDLSGVEKPIDRLEEPLSLGEETPGYDPVTGEMVIYRPWGNFTIFYGDFRYSDELVPLGKVESGLEIISGQTEDFTGRLEILED